MLNKLFIKLFIKKSTTVGFKLMVVLLFIAPISIGLVGTWLPAFGYLPSIGSNSFTWQPMLDVFDHPSTFSSIKTSLISSLLSTLISFLISQWLCFQLYQTNSWQWLNKLIAPLLAIPHLAFSIGLAFLLSPSGWIMRLVSPFITGFSVPPDWLIVNDIYTLSLTLGLIIKEVPFLLLMSMAAFGSFDLHKNLQIAATYRYSKSEAWLKLVFVQMFAQLRLPLLAVFSYSLSVVDLSIILGPAAPATFAVVVDQWFNDANVNQRLLGAAGATLLLCILLIFIFIFYILEKLTCLIAKEWLIAGANPLRPIKKISLSWLFAHLSLYFIALTTIMSIASLLIWSFSRQWRFPDFLPSLWSLKYWYKSWQQLLEPLFNTAVIGLSSALIGMLVSLFLLHWQSQNQDLNRADKSIFNRENKVQQRLLWIVYLPMLVPQVSFLFGVQIFMINLNMDASFWGVIWVHVIFVLPYCYLTLSRVFLQFDNRFYQLGSSLSGSRWRGFWQVKFPMLLKPIAFSFAIGFAVSVSQYLPSLYIGAGRINTITIESVALASGSDDRISAVFALWQFALPLLLYVIAINVPKIIYKNRRGL